MGKLSSAARAARGGNRAKKTSKAKLANKRRQRTPKVVRKQMNRAHLRRQEEMEQIAGRANKRLKQLSFNTMTNDIKDELNGIDNSKNNAMSRSERNKFSRQNKKLKKFQLKQQQQDAIFDFSSYDRQIEQDISSEEENEDLQYQQDTDDEDQMLQQFEKTHTVKSYDVRKSKLPYKSAEGHWIHDNEQIDKHYIDREVIQSEGEDADVVINESEIADYMNLGNIMNEETKEDLEDEDDDDIKMNELQPQKTKKISVTDWKLKKKLRMNQVKLEIADMGEKILQDPYKNCCLLPIIYELCQDADVQICQLAMLSLTRIIIDIMPPYKIGTIGQNVALKQSSEKVRDFEKTLLNSYQSYLKHIFKLARIYHSNTRNKTKRKDPKRFILGKCAVKCILLFVRKCSHFNYTKELIKNAIPLTNCNVEEIRKDSCRSIESLLRHTPINNVTVECVQLLTQRIEKKNFNVHPDQITVFEKLPLQYLEPPQEDESDNKIKPTKSRWEKEMDKKMKKDEKEMAGLDKKKQFTRQKMIIEKVFGVYFYILKLEVSPKLLEPALQGMSKFAHLINVELVLDLISCVSEKLEKEGDKLSLPCKLHCISTTFKVLSGRGTSIDMDVRQHYETIYAALLSVTLNHYEWQYFPIIFECMNSMFGHHASKSLPVDRVASFVKRLINISLQLPPCYGIACQHQARKLMITDPRLYNMLDFEGGYDKEYDAFEKNPDHANSLSCCLWELTSTCNHFHPFHKVYSRDLTTWSEIPLKLSASTPDKVMYKYDVHRSGNYRPFVQESKLQKFSMIKHPPKDLNNAESMEKMANWFRCRHRKIDNNRHQQRLKRITKAVLNGNKTAEDVIKKYAECGDLLAKNRVLKDLNQEYKLLNQLLQTD